MKKARKKLRPLAGHREYAVNTLGAAFGKPSDTAPAASTVASWMRRRHNQGRDMLVLTLRNDETVVIHPMDGLHPDTTIAELFEDGPITMALGKIRGKQAKLGIETHPALSVMRGEVVEGGS